jgi:PAS domain S-box-containing protein
MLKRPYRRIQAAWLTLFVGLASLGLFVTVTLAQEHGTMAQMELNRLQTQARVVGGNLGQQLGGVSRGLQDILAEAPTVQTAEGQASLSRLLKVYGDSMATVTKMTLLDGEGLVLASSHWYDQGKLTGLDRRFGLPFSRLDPERLYFSSLTEAARANPTVARVSLDATGAVKWMAVAELNTHYFKELLDSVRYRSDVRVRFLVGGAELIVVPETPSDDDRLEVERSVSDVGVDSPLALSVTVSAQTAAVFSLWTARLVDYLVLVGTLVAFSLGLLLFLQRREEKFEASEKENAERLRMAHEAAEVGVWEYEVTGNRMRWDANMYRLHGLKPENYDDATQAWRTSILPEDVPQAEAFLESVREADHTVSTKLRYRTETGDLRIFRTMAKGFPDKGGTCLRVVGIHQDITQSVEDQLQLKQLNLDLKQRTLEAEEASRSKSRFLANMSHEIRTPMNAVLGLLAILGKTTLDWRQRDYVKKAESAGRFLLTLLNDVLDLSKAEAGKLVLERAPFNLHTVLNDVAVILGTMAAGKKVEVIFDVSPALPRMVAGDSFRLHQILLNLGGNAIKFTEQGSVTVGVVLRGATGGRAELDFFVADTGIGIAEDKLADIFQGFVQAEASTTRRFGGSGLGLSICRFLIGKMGGQLRVESRLGEGSRFSFSVALDLVEDTEALRGNVPGGLRVLFADGNARTREVLQQMTSTLGWTADTADGIESALSQLASGREPVKVLLVDAGLPDAGAVPRAVDNLILAERPALVLVSSLGHDDAASPRWDGHISKPITPSALVDLIEGLARTRPLESAPGEPRLKGRRILVVEDHPVNRLVAQELLEKEGALVALAPGGEAALAEMERAGFDCVLMDLQMPGMDGFETTRRIRRRFGDEPFIVALTANALPADRDACLEAGMNNHVGKPLELERLVQTILGGKDAPMAEPLASIDWDGALSRLNGDGVLLRRVAENFLAAAGGFVDTLAGPAPVDEWLRAAHTLKGLSATVGAGDLAREAARLETLLRDGNEPPFQVLKRYWDETRRALKTRLEEDDHGSGQH